MLRTTYRTVRRLLVLVLGVSVVLVGIIMVVTPGPAFIVIPAGLAILATEFVWARVLLTRMRDRVRDQLDRRVRRRAPPGGAGDGGEDGSGEHGTGSETQGGDGAPPAQDARRH